MFTEYVQAGWSICAIDPGSKSPRYEGWNVNPIPAEAADALDGAGLLHSLSGTCALDIDNLAIARDWLAERGVDVDALLDADDAVRISSGRANRAKLIYKLSKPMRTLKPTGSGIELRSATADGKSVQDVLPPTIHPDTKRPYVWQCGILADKFNPPTIPSSLLAAWRELADPVAAGPTVAPAPSADVDRLRALLAKHNPDCSYDDWLKAGMAIHHETSGAPVGLAVWDEWSKKSTKYKGAADLKGHWVSFSSKAGKRVVTAASLDKTEVAKAEEFPEVIIEPNTSQPEPIEGEIQQAAPQSPSKHVPRIGAALKLQMDEAGKIRCNLHNAEVVLKNMTSGSHFQLYRDTFLLKQMIKEPGGEVRSFEDRDYATVRATLQAAGLSKLSPYDSRDAIERVVGNNARDCVKDWLESLKWDGKRRLSRWLQDAYGAPASRYIVRTGRNWLIAMVARAYQPGAKCDYAFILEGETGIKKSFSFVHLVPELAGERLYAELTANPESKDMEQQIRGIWLGEFAEGWLMERASVKRLKQFVTNQYDHFRPSYGRHEVTLPRRCIFVGTTNDTVYLQDSTGNRRFYPIECTTVDLEYIKANRDQLFAEAVNLFKAKRKWWIWPKEEATEMQSSRLVSDSWAPVIQAGWEMYAKEMPSGLSCFGQTRFVVANDLLPLIGVSIDKSTLATTMRISSVLKVLGFKPGPQHRIPGTMLRVRPWFPPVDVSADPLLAGLDLTDPLLA